MSILCKLGDWRWVSNIYIMVGNKPPFHSILQVLATKLVITRKIVSWLKQRNIGFLLQFKRWWNLQSFIYKSTNPKIDEDTKKRIDKYKLKSIKGYNIMLVACTKPIA
jgi:hypothetical protein